MASYVRQSEVSSAVNAVPAPQPEAQVRVEPAGVDIEVFKGETLFDAAWREGYDWPTICLGQALCTACHVRLREGEENVSPLVEREEQQAVQRISRRLYKGDTTGVRLACRLFVTGAVIVEQSKFCGDRRAEA